MRKKLLAGAAVGGVLLGLWAMIAGGSKETLRGSVQERHLKATALTLPVLYDAKLITTVSAQVTLHDQNPIPVLNRVPALRDWRNHTLTDTADVVVNVGTKLESLQATPDPHTGKLTVVLRGDPDPTSPTWCCRRLSIRPPKESRITATWVMCSSTPSSIQRRPWRRRWVRISYRRSTIPILLLRKPPICSCMTRSCLDRTTVRTWGFRNSTGKTAPRLSVSIQRTHPRR